MDNLAIKYGETRTTKISETAISLYKNINDALMDLKGSYVKLGYYLHECDKRLFYVDFGYINVYEFALANFGLSKSSVSRCLSVARNFCKKVKGKITCELDDKYKGFSYSQLTEMLPLVDTKQLEAVNPEMTVKEIRSLKASTAVSNPHKAVATSQQSETVSHDITKHDIEAIGNKIPEPEYEVIATMTSSDGTAFDLVNTTPLPDKDLYYHMLHAYNVTCLASSKMTDDMRTKYSCILSSLESGYKAFFKALNKNV